MGLFKKKKTVDNKNVQVNNTNQSSGGILADNPSLMVAVDPNNVMTQGNVNNQAVVNSNNNFENLQGLEIRQKVKETVKLYKFRYTAKKENGKKVTSIFEAQDIDDCRRFLELQGYHDIKVVPKQTFDIEISLSNKLKVGDLAFDLTQLSTYIKAGIPLVDAVRILSKQCTKPAQRHAYEKLVYDLLKGDNLSGAMEKQSKAFPQLLINMVRSAEMTGDLSTILDDMAEYYESMEQTRKAMRSALTYPLMVLILAIGVLVFMLVYLVPQFVELYSEQGASLPKITRFIIGASNFLKYNYMYIIAGFSLITFIFVFCFLKIQKFKQFIQTLIMRVPVIGNIIIYKEVYNFTKTFASLINHGVFITDSMEILSKITNNEIYKKIIDKTLSNLSKGETISSSFRGEWAFPEVAYHMLVTGENTGQLGVMMEKVSEHYQALHKSLVDQMKGLIEPIMILLVAGIVGVILLSIITPMFGIYGQIQQ